MLATFNGVEITIENYLFKYGILLPANKLDYFQGNVVKYVSRYKDKNGLEDLKKARHYIDKIIENDYTRTVPCPPQKEAGQE